MGRILFPARLGIVAVLLMGFAAPAARADPLKIYNNTGVKIVITLDGGWPFVETAVVSPGPPVTRDVWRLAPQRHVIVIENSTGITRVDKTMYLGHGVKSIVIQKFPFWDVRYGN